jgi:hypothetical protein
MAMISKDKKYDIRDTVVRETLKHKDAQYQADVDELAIAIYRTFVSEEQEALMATFPSGFFVKQKQIRYTAKGGSSTIDLPTERLMPHIMGERWGGNHIDDYPVMALYYKLIEFRSSLDNAKKTLQEKIWAILLSVNTDKQLEQAWPEGREYYMGFFTKNVGRYLPATVTTELNSMINYFKEC